MFSRSYSFAFTQQKRTLESRLFQVLRLAVVMCFIGHGTFGIITKQIWCNYFGVFGIDQNTAYQLMPWLGALDILLGLIMLIYPIRAVALWLVVWGFITAFLRPLSGEPVAELIERAGNFGAPLALLVLCGLPNDVESWFKPMKPTLSFEHNDKQLQQLVIYLQTAGFLLLAGHGWLNLVHKSSLLAQYTSLGFNQPVITANTIGACELLFALIIFIKPIRSFLVVILLWKITSELFYPHYELLEFVERGGSYCCLLALWIISLKIPVWRFDDTRHHRIAMEKA